MFEFLRSNNKKDMSQEQLKINFESQEQWAGILDLSKEQTVYVFKHSSRCGISSMVLNRFEKQMKERNETYFYLHIQNSRFLSNWIAEELHIRHESPQLIILKDTKVLHYDSHYALLEILPPL